MFTITFNDGFELSCAAPVSGVEILRQHPAACSSPAVAWHVNGYLRPLGWIVEGDARADWVDLSSSEGVDVYQNSLSFLLTIAVKRVLDRSICVSNSISEGLFWQLEVKNADSIVSETESFSSENVAVVKAEMDRLISADLPIRTEITAVDKAADYFISQGRRGKAELLGRTMSEQPIEMVECDGVKDMFCNPLVPSTGYLKTYELTRLAPGMVLRFPTLGSNGQLPLYTPSKKLLSVFLDYADWMKKMHVVTMVQIWDDVARDGGKELILMSEALHAQQISRITDDFLSQPERRVITIAGPSASGKTTTSHKLRIQLQVRGKHPIALSLDDYFVDRDQCPIEENGEYDFEALESLNLDLLDQQINDLLRGKTVRLPKFNFYSGRSEQGRELRLEEDDVLIIEGLHGLNDRIIGMMPPEKRFSLFLSPMTSINIDQHTRIGTTDQRLLRRLLRDVRTRGNGVEATLERWPSVIRGGMKYIFPYQKNADAMFNSSLLYELPVMRLYAEILLRGVGTDSPVHGEAMRLLRLLRSIPIIDAGKVPSNSLLREFIGGSIIEI